MTTRSQRILPVSRLTLAPGAKKGTATLGPGTGKYKGIDGNLEWEVVTSLSAATGTYNFIGKKRGSYRLP